MSKEHAVGPVPRGAVERTPEAAEGVSGAAPLGSKRRRWTAARKLEAIFCVVKGQSLDSVSRKFGIGQSELSKWYRTFLNSAEDLLKSKESSEPFEEEKKEMLTKIGQITMDNELLREKIRRMENGTPFHLRK